MISFLWKGINWPMNFLMRKTEKCVSVANGIGSMEMLLSFK